MTEQSNAQYNELLKKYMQGKAEAALTTVMTAGLAAADSVGLAFMYADGSLENALFALNNHWGVLKTDEKAKNFFMSTVASAVDSASHHIDEAVKEGIPERSQDSVEGFRIKVGKFASILASYGYDDKEAKYPRIRLLAKQYDERSAKLKVG